MFEQAVGELVNDGITAVWVSHDAAQLRRVADVVLRIDDGRYDGSERVERGPRTEEV